MELLFDTKTVSATGAMYFDPKNLSEIVVHRRERTVHKDYVTHARIIDGAFYPQIHIQSVNSTHRGPVYTPLPTPSRTRARTAPRYRAGSNTKSSSTPTAKRGRFSPPTTEMTKMTRIALFACFWARARASGGSDAEARCARLIGFMDDRAGLWVWS